MGSNDLLECQHELTLHPPLSAIVSVLRRRQVDNQTEETENRTAWNCGIATNKEEE